MATRAEDVFRERFGSAPGVVTTAPGRVNLIGEHTDTSGGFVFPAAIDRSVVVAAGFSAGDCLLESLQLGSGTSFEASSVEPGRVDGWAKYMAGVAWALREAGHSVSNLKVVVDSDVPVGAGVSSSAALEVALTLAWSELEGMGLGPTEMAKIGQRCENGFVGVSSGIMDQMASAHGKAGHAMLLDTRSLALEHVLIPAGLDLVLSDTGKIRALASSAYNERRAQCEAAARVLGVEQLRDATLDLVESCADRLSPVEFRRAKHVVTENRRCLAFRDALASNDRDTMGVLMKESHESLRDDFEVSCRELDAMAEAAWSDPACVGARMTGAGFGGACIALVEAASLDRFVARAGAAYASASGSEGTLTPCKASDGARHL